MDFARNPPASWTGKRNVARYVLKDGMRTPNPRWRPYVSAGKEYVLSQAALQSLFSVLSSFFNFLIQENYAAANPVAEKCGRQSKFLRGPPGPVAHPPPLAAAMGIRHRGGRKMPRKSRRSTNAHCSS